MAAPRRIGSPPPRREGGCVNVVVEIPRGGHNKYEWDEEVGLFRYDRPLHSSVYYPTDYGFVPGACSEDGEKLDALVLIDQPTFPGCLIETRVLGAIAIEHQSGLREQKLLAVPVREPRFEAYEDLDDVPKHMLREIEHFFDVFKQLEERPVRSVGWVGSHEAGEVLEAAARAYREAG